MMSVYILKENSVLLLYLIVENDGVSRSIFFFFRKKLTKLSKFSRKIIEKNFEKRKINFLVAETKDVRMLNFSKAS